MKPLPPEVSVGQLLDILQGKKPKPVPKSKRKTPLNGFWTLSKPDRVRVFSVRDPIEYRKQWEEYKDSIPRTYSKFRAKVKAIEARREQLAKLQAKKERNRARYRRTMGLE